MKKILAFFLVFCISLFSGQSYKIAAVESTVQTYKDKITLSALKVMSVKDNATTFDKVTEVPIDKPMVVNPSGKFNITDIDGVVVEGNGEMIPVQITKTGGKELQIKPVTPYSKNSKYILKVFTKQQKKFYLDFYTQKQPIINSVDAQGWEQVKLSNKIDGQNPSIKLSQLNKTAKDISAITFEQDGKIIGLKYEFTETGINIKEELALNKSYSLKLVTADNKKLKVNFETMGLPEIYDDGTRRIVKVPAMPEEGFYWPYFLALPSNQFKEQNKGSKRYLMIDTNNTGASNDFNVTLSKTQDEIQNMWQASMSFADQLWSPMLMPVFPRPLVSYNYDNEFNYFYTHSLDRDTAALHLMMKDPILATILTDGFKQAGYDVNKFIKLDQQLAAMAKHAIKYLNQYGNKVENKVFLSGYSASGEFTDRFAYLQPSLVKAVATGSTNDDMMLPLAQYKGKNLIFPIGTYDYKDITGRAYNQSEQDKIARLIYMGEDDTNNVVQTSDCYGDKERDIIVSLWGMDILPRAQQLSKLYGESGGKGVIILDKGVGHGASPDMNRYALEFFKANRDKELPEYPVPKNPQQLKYTIY